MELKEAEKITSDFIKTMKSVFDFLEKDKIYPDFEKVELEAIETVLQALEELQKENEKLKEIDLTTVHIKGVCDEKARWRNKIKEKIEEIKEYDKKHKTYTSDGRENFTMEYMAIPILEELLKGE